MKKVFRSRAFFLALLFILFVSAFSFIAYAKSRSVCAEAQDCCLKTESGNGSEMLWDILSRQFVSAVHLP